MYNNIHCFLFSHVQKYRILSLEKHEADAKENSEKSANSIKWQLILCAFSNINTIITEKNTKF